MPTYDSARGEKPDETASRPRWDNVIVSYWRATQGGMAWTQTLGAPAPGASLAAQAQWNIALLDGLLRITGASGNLPLLWAYSNDDGLEQYVFGYDRIVANGSKIGHVAMIKNATISGEITLTPAGAWELDNNSGAWGNMGGQDGKSAQLIACAAELTGAPFNLGVTAKRAYSKNAAKRGIQQLFQRFR